MAALTNLQVAAELRAVALAIRLFGLDALPHVLRTQPTPEGTPPAVTLRANHSRQGT